MAETPAETTCAPLVLTDRERDVLALVANGHTNIEIGARLFLSRHTVKEYLSGAMRKLEVSNRVAAALEATRRGLIVPSASTADEPRWRITAPVDTTGTIGASVADHDIRMAPIKVRGTRARAADRRQG